ncbi:MAG: hypothetical protein WB502_16015 [Thermoactinomyces sp.]
MDYKKELLRLLSDIPGNFDTEHKRKIAVRYRNVLLRFHNMMTEKSYRNMYESLTTGDPKSRSLRSFYFNILTDYRRQNS